MRLFLVLGILSVGLCSLNTAAQTGRRGHLGHHSKIRASPNGSAGKFVPDETLKVRMSAILEAVETVRGKKSKDKNPSQVIKAGRDIESTVQDIFKTCKLAPAEDAAIHPILAQILDGAGFFKKGDKRGGLDKIHPALLKYRNTFDHPGFRKNE